MSHFYAVKLTLDPEKSFIKATAKLRYIVSKEQSQLEFILHRDLSLASVHAEGLQSYACTGSTSFPFAPEGVTWRLEFAAPLLAGTYVDITFSYEGSPAQPMCQPWEINRLTASWVELSSYSPWFPWNPNGGPFTYEIDLSIDRSYALSGTGNVITPSPGCWHITETMPVQDMVLLASPHLIDITAESAKVQLTVSHLPEEDASVMSSLMEESLWMLDYYQQWLDDVGQAPQCKIVVAPREKGGGYARPGLIVLSSISGEAGGFNARMFRYIGHELAHLWWARAPVDSWEDWLNESFAEYSALISLRTRYGNAVLAAVLEQRAEGLKGLPAIRGLARTDDNAYPVLYHKGSSLLLQLDALIGPEKMKELLRAMQRLKVQATADFLALLSSITSEDIAREFDAWLSQ